MVDFAVVDSGTGGLPYLDYLKEKCPAASCVYYADTKNFPYGTKSHTEIVDSIVPVIKSIIEKHEPRAIIIACNTITVNALDDLRNAFPEIPIVGTVPAIKLAASVTKNKKIGLLATEATVQNPYIEDLEKKFASDCEIILRGDTALVDFIEKKSFTATETECENACRPAVDFFCEKGCDTIILGCTHFLNLSGTIQKVAGEKIKVVDSRDGVVRRALSVCQVEEKQYTKTTLYVTGEKNTPEYEAVCKRYNLEMK